MADKKFDRQKHKSHLGKENELKAMVDDQGETIRGAMGSSGVAQVVGTEGEELGADKIILNPGASFPLHTHSGAHVLYVLRGRGFLSIDGQDQEMKQGDLFSVAADLPHAMRASKNSFLRVLAIGYPHKHVEAQDRLKLVEPKKP